MNEKVKQIEKELIEIYDEENKELEDELVDLLKETEEKSSELREKIAENKKFVKAIKSRWDEKEEEIE